MYSVWVEEIDGFYELVVDDNWFGLILDTSHVAITTPTLSGTFPRKRAATTHPVPTHPAIFPLLAAVQSCLLIVALIKCHV